MKPKVTLVQNMRWAQNVCVRLVQYIYWSVLQNWMTQGKQLCCNQKKCSRHAYSLYSKLAQYLIIMQEPLLCDCLVRAICCICCAPLLIRPWFSYRKQCSAERLIRTLETATHTPRHILWHARPLAGFKVKHRQGEWGLLCLTQCNI